MSRPKAPARRVLMCSPECWELVKSLVDSGEERNMTAATEAAIHAYAEALPDLHAYVRRLEADQRAHGWAGVVRPQDALKHAVKEALEHRKAK